MFLKATFGMIGCLYAVGDPAYDDVRPSALTPVATAIHQLLEPQIHAINTWGEQFMPSELQNARLERPMGTLDKSIGKMAAN